MAAPERKPRFSRLRSDVAADDGLVRAIELVATPMIFAGFGWLLDRWLGTTPVFLIVLAALALLGKVLAEYYRYTHQMDKHATELSAERPSNARVIETVEEPDGRLPAGITLGEDPAVGGDPAPASQVAQGSQASGDGRHG